MTTACAPAARRATRRATRRAAPAQNPLRRQSPADTGHRVPTSCALTRRFPRASNSTCASPRTRTRGCAVARRVKAAALCAQWKAAKSSAREMWNRGGDRRVARGAARLARACDAARPRPHASGACCASGAARACNRARARAGYRWPCMTRLVGPSSRAFALVLVAPRRRRVARRPPSSRWMRRWRSSPPPSWASSTWRAPAQRPVARPACACATDRPLLTADDAYLLARRLLC